MAASDHLGEQLKMFMSPSEINPDWSVDLEPGARMEDLWREKLVEAHHKGLYDDISKRGVRTPIQLIHDPVTGQTIMGNGHHRVAVAKDIEATKDPNILIPVIHTSAQYKPNSGAVDEYKSLSEYSRYMQNYITQGSLKFGSDYKKDWEDL